MSSTQTLRRKDNFCKASMSSANTSSSSHFRGRKRRSRSPNRRVNNDHPGTDNKADVPVIRRQKKSCAAENGTRAEREKVHPKERSRSRESQLRRKHARNANTPAAAVAEADKALDAHSEHCSHVSGVEFARLKNEIADLKNVSASMRTTAIHR
jgi:hypothetical protein